MHEGVVDESSILLRIFLQHTLYGLSGPATIGAGSHIFSLLSGTLRPATPP